jgi:hypothetical protein
MKNTISTILLSFFVLPLLIIPNYVWSEDKIQFKIALLKDTYEEGEPVIIEASLKNISLDTLHQIPNPHHVYVDYRVDQISGEKYSDGSWGCVRISACCRHLPQNFINIPPGKIVTTLINLFKRYPCGFTVGQYSLVGVYSEGFLSMSNYVPELQGNNDIRIIAGARSNSLTFFVVPRRDEKRSIALEMRLYSDKNVFYEGEEIGMTIVITNYGNENIRVPDFELSFDTFGRLEIKRMENDRYDVSGLKRNIEPPVGEPMITYVDQGTKHASFIELNGYYGDRLPSGKYQVRAVYDNQNKPLNIPKDEEEYEYWKSIWRGRLESNAIEFTILPKEKK